MSRHFAFCLLWSILTALTLLTDCLFWNRILDQKQIVFIAFASAAGFVAAGIARLLEPVISGKRPGTARCATVAILLAGGTVGGSFLGSAAYTVQYFLPWMAPMTSAGGLENLFFFTLSHGYLFAAMAARLFLPLGPFCLFLAALLYCFLWPTARNRD